MACFLQVKPEQTAEAAEAAQLAALAAELGVAVEELSVEDVAAAEAELADLTDEELDALLAANSDA